MKAYPIFWLNSDNYVGIVTSETDKTANEVLELIMQHYPELRDYDLDNLYVIDGHRHVHSK